MSGPEGSSTKYVGACALFLYLKEKGVSFTVLKQEGLTVVLVGKNQETKIDSVLSQLQSQDVITEILLVDLHSTDRSQEKMNEWKEKEERVEVLHSSADTINAGWNQGLAQAKGKYVCFLSFTDTIPQYFPLWIQAEIAESEITLSAKATKRDQNLEERLEQFTQLSLSTQIYRKEFLDRFSFRFLNSKEASWCFHWITLLAADRISTCQSKVKKEAFPVQEIRWLSSFHHILTIAKVRPEWHEILLSWIQETYFVQFFEQLPKDLSFVDYQKYRKQWISWFEEEEATQFSHPWAQLLWQEIQQPKEGYLFWKHYVTKEMRYQPQALPLYYRQKLDTTLWPFSLFLTAKKVEEGILYQGFIENNLGLSVKQAIFRVSLQNDKEVLFPTKVKSQKVKGGWQISFVLPKTEEMKSQDWKWQWSLGYHPLRLQNEQSVEFQDGLWQTSSYGGRWEAPLTGKNIKTIAKKDLFGVTKEGKIQPIEKGNEHQWTDVFAFIQGKVQAVHLDGNGVWEDDCQQYEWKNHQGYLHLEKTVKTTIVGSKGAMYLPAQRKGWVLWDEKNHFLERYAKAEEITKEKLQALADGLYQPYYLYEWQGEWILSPIQHVGKQEQTEEITWFSNRIEKEERQVRSAFPALQFFIAQKKKLKNQVLLQAKRDSVGLAHLVSSLEDDGWKVQVALPKGVRASYLSKDIVVGTKSYIQALAQSKYLISECTLPTYYHLKKGQVTAQWINGPLRARGKIKDQKEEKKQFNRAKHWFVENQAQGEQWKKEVGYNGEVHAIGFPWAEEMYYSTKKKEWKQNYGLDPKKKVIGLLLDQDTLSQVPYSKDYQYIVSFVEEISDNQWSAHQFTVEEIGVLCDVIFAKEERVLDTFSLLAKPLYLVNQEGNYPKVVPGEIPSIIKKMNVQYVVPSREEKKITPAYFTQWGEKLATYAATPRNESYIQPYLSLWAHKGYEILFALVGILPKTKTICFESFYGEKATDNPKALYDYMIKNHPEYRCIWNVKKGYESVFKEQNLPYVVNNSLSALWVQARAQYWVYNTRLVPWKKPPRHTYLLQTWHGTPWKKLGLDIESVHLAGVNTKEYYQEFLQDVQKWDRLIAPNEYAFACFQSAFALPAEKIMLTGYPRIQALIEKEKQAKEIKEQLKIPKEKKVVLYAPTWRDSENQGQGNYSFAFPFSIEKVKAALGEEVVLLLRLHYLIHQDLEISVDGVYDVSEYPEINDLYVISDLLITDYSSVFFDYSVLQKPMLFYAYDEEQYEKERGAYFAYQKVPGPIVKTEDDLIQKTKELLEEKSLSRWNQQKMLPYIHLEDGKESERVTEQLFAPVIGVWEEDENFLTQKAICQGRGSAMSALKEGEEEFGLVPGEEVIVHRCWNYIDPITQRPVGWPQYYIEATQGKGYVHGYQLWGFQPNP